MIFLLIVYLLITILLLFSFRTFIHDLLNAVEKREIWASLFFSFIVLLNLTGIVFGMWGCLYTVWRIFT